jgi:hypothetical protein
MLRMFLHTHRIFHLPLHLPYLYVNAHTLNLQPRFSAIKVAWTTKNFSILRNTVSASSLSFYVQQLSAYTNHSQMCHTILLNTPATNHTILPILYYPLGSNPSSFYRSKQVYMANCLHCQSQLSSWSNRWLVQTPVHSTAASQSTWPIVSMVSHSYHFEVTGAWFKKGHKYKSCCPLTAIPTW